MKQLQPDATFLLTEKDRVAFIKMLANLELGHTIHIASTGDKHDIILLAFKLTE